MASNTIRFSGLSSGLDTESMVKAMIAPQKAKVDYAVQDKKLFELKKEAWKSMNTKIYSFYTGKLNTLKFMSSFGKTTNNISNPSVIAVDANATVPQGTHSIKVTQTAKAAALTTQSMTDSTKPLEQLGYDVGDKIELTVNGQLASVSVTSGMTASSLATSMNADLAAKNITNVNFKFESSLNGFVVGTKDTGSTQVISMNVGAANPPPAIPSTLTSDQKLASLGITTNTDSGDNAKFTYNDGSSFESQTNKVEVNGLKFTILSTSADPVIISSTKDTASQVEFIKDLVKEYNSLLEEMNTSVDATSNRSYRPLTDEQKESMSENDIKLWEDKIKVSILRKDSTLEAISDKMRNILGASDMHKIGITTGVNYKEKGKLYIDENKLQAALEKDPVQVTEIVKKVGVNLYDDIKQRLKGGKDKSSNYLFPDKVLESSINYVDKKILTLQDRLDAQEDAYYKKYAAMEKMLSQLNSQGSSLTSMLGGQ